MGQTLTFEEFSNGFEPKILFEVSIKRSPVLKQIDQLFYELKVNPNDRKVWKSLEKRISELRQRIRDSKLHSIWKFKY